MECRFDERRGAVGVVDEKHARPKQDRSLSQGAYPIKPLAIVILTFALKS